MARQKFGNMIVKDKNGHPISAMTQGQFELIQTIDENDIIFVNGPAGCGKTFLAVCKAVSAMDDNEYDHLVLTRPAVEAGEELGFLPGDLNDKITPYMRPLYDSIEKLKGKRPKEDAKDVNLGKTTKGMPPKGMKRKTEAMRASEAAIKKADDFYSKVEISPLAYMRGATFDRAFIILDEAQNVTAGQMKLLLTRMGNHSKIVICGDATQTDLDGRVKSGFRHAQRLLGDVPRIGFVTMTEQDIVRHKLVKDIILKYENDPEKQGYN